MDSNNFSDNVGVGEREGRVSESHAVVDPAWTLQIVVPLPSRIFEMVDLAAWFTWRAIT